MIFPKRIIGKKDIINRMILNQMSVVWDPAGLEAYYGFSEDGERLYKTFKYWDGFRVGEEDENYLYDFSDTTRDYDGGWNLKKEYFRGASIDEIIFEKTSDGEIRYYYTDALGSTRQLCDSDGNNRDIFNVTSKNEE